MSPNLVLLILRLLAVLAVYAFLAAALWIVWRDLRAVEAASAARQKPLGRLMILDARADGLEAGQVFALHPLTSLGRAPTNAVPLPDETASLEHALISLRAGRWWLEDLGSRNGTTLNEAPVSAPVVVSAGDVIGVGRVRLKLELE